MHYDKKPGLERRRKCWTLAAEEPVPALAEPLCVGDQAHFSLGLPLSLLARREDRNEHRAGSM